MSEKRSQIWLNLMVMHTSTMLGKDVIWTVTKGGKATQERLQKTVPYECAIVWIKVYKRLPKKVNVVLGVVHGKLTALGEVFSSLVLARLHLEIRFQHHSLRENKQKRATKWSEI